MKRINLEQGSPEWLAYRRKKRPASDAGAMMGANPYKTRYQLFVERRDGSTFEGNAATRHGNNTEAAARACLSRILGVDLVPAVFEEGVYSASLDAYGVKGHQSYKGEIKCPFNGVESDLWKRAKRGSDSTEDLIHPMYQWQLVHQDYAIPTTHSYFFVYLDDDNWELIGWHSSASKIKKLLDGWEDFEANEPEPDFIEIADTEIIAQVHTHRLLVEQKKALESNIKVIEKALKKGVTQNSMVNGSKLTWVTRKGNVQYQAIPALHDVDLEQYRGKDTRYMKITHGADREGEK